MVEADVDGADLSMRVGEAVDRWAAEVGSPPADDGE
jgi:hypothetical protein